MSQTSITSFFNSRKRPASEDIVGSKSKIAHIERKTGTGKPVSKTIVQKCNIVKDVRNSVPNGITLNGLKNTISARICLAQASPSKNEPEHKDLAVFAKKQNISNISKNTEPKIQNVNSARQELSLGDIRKKLAGSSRLAELRATAERLSKGIQELKEASDKKNLREFKSIDVEVPSRSVFVINFVKC